MNRKPRKKRLLVATPALRAGAGRVITDLALSMCQRGFRIEIASSGRHIDPPDWPMYGRALSDAGVSVSTVDFFHRDSTTVWKSASLLRRKLTDFRPDLIHVHGGTPALAADMLPEAGAVPRLGTHHSWGPGRPKWMDQADGISLSSLDRVACVSSYGVRQLKALGVPARKLMTIPLGIRHGQLQASRRARVFRNRWGVSDKELLFGMLASVEPRKNQELAVRAFLQYAATRKNPGALVLIGKISDREYADRLLQLIPESASSPRILLTDYLENSYAALAEVDVFLFPTRSEGLGIALLEAMALALPSISSCLEGTRDIIRKNENAIAADPDQMDEWVEAMQNLADRPDLRKSLGEQAREFVETHFRWEHTLERYEELYRELLH